jgi:hypothetical protein
MDPTTSLITTVTSICVVVFGIVAIASSLYGILVWFPAQRKKKVDALKAAGRQGEATVLRLPDHVLRQSSTGNGVFKLVSIGLEIRVPGLDIYEVDKVFTIPSSAVRELYVGKVVAVWVDPKEPRNLDKIVIHLD